MLESGISYPHPVLGNGDDIANSVDDIRPNLECRIYDESVVLTINDLETKHRDIDGLIRSGDAAWLIRFNCSRTYYREAFLTRAQSWNNKFDGPDFIGKVSIDISVVAVKEIEGYAPNGMHSDYGDARFSIAVGELIAIAPAYTFHAEKDFDALKAPVASLIRVEKGSDDIGPFRCTYDDDLIIVSLSKADWYEYAAIRDRVPTTLHTSIVLPVLVGALTRLNDGEAVGLAWSDRLEEIVARMELDIEEPLMSAQIILSNPLERAFAEVNKELDKRGG